MHLILASTSPSRRELLGRLGVPFECVPPGVDENAVKREEPDPARLAARLAAMKAGAVAADHADATVIGSDSVAVVGGVIVGKPGTADRAVAQLEAARDGGMDLLTAVCVLGGGRRFGHLVRSRLTLRDLTRDELRRYVARDDPTWCAGSFKIESAGIGLFASVESDDWTAVQGLPLIAVCGALRELGFRVP